MNINQILLKKSLKVLSCHDDVSSPYDSKQLLVTFLREIEPLGYTFSKELIEKLLKTRMTPEFFQNTFETLKEMRGIRNYTPMYPNFPQQVMEASEAELYLNAMMHYLSFQLTDMTGANQEWLPKYSKTKRSNLSEEVKLTVINQGTFQDFFEISNAILSSNTSISEENKEILQWSLQNFHLSSFKFPERIVQKETLAFVAGVLMSLDKIEALNGMFSTSTDVLRLIVALSDGEVSLAKSTKFRKFSKKERRSLLSLIETVCTNPLAIEDMNRHIQPWLRIGEKLHPTQYQSRYPLAANAFSKLRNSKIVTFNSKVHKFLTSNKKQNISEFLSLLSSRPGEFARRLDVLLRNARNNLEKNEIVSAFKNVAENVSTPVLLQVFAHFDNRSERNNDERIIFPKGNIAKIQSIPSISKPISFEFARHICMDVELVLQNRFETLPSLGKVYLDENLKDYLVPFSQRSASKSLRTLVRGSKIVLEPTNTLRFFMWWKEPKGNRTDLDLSAILYDADWNQLEQVAYFNLKSSRYKAYHSGDVTSAPNGACEFIDVDCASILEYGARYLIPMVNSFTHQNFSELPEAFVGWMGREFSKSGEIFEPSTVKDRLDITSESTQCMPMIFDLVDNKVIWTDSTVKNTSSYNNVSAKNDKIALVGKAFTKIKKPTLYDLFRFHANVRGTDYVDNISEADTIFSLNEGITPFQLDRISSEFMMNAIPKTVRTGV